MTQVRATTLNTASRIPRPRTSDESASRAHPSAAAEPVFQQRIGTSKQRVYRAAALLFTMACIVIALSGRGWGSTLLSLLGAGVGLGFHHALREPGRLAGMERLALGVAVCGLAAADLARLLMPFRGAVPGSAVWFVLVICCLALTPRVATHAMVAVWLGHTGFTWIHLVMNGGPVAPEVGRTLVGPVAIGLLTLLNRYHRVATISLANNHSLRTLAMTDDLTGLPNRRAMYQELALRDGELAVVMIDLDNFKRVNDTAGHEAGDQVLQQVARVLEQEAGNEAIVGRWGGEEFVAILETWDLPAAQVLGERMRQRAQAHPDLRGVTLSVGVTRQRVGERSTTVLRRADELMYEAKQGGKNRVLARA